MKMDIRYWENKFDPVTEADLEDLNKVFFSSNYDKNIIPMFGDEERYLLAKILLQGSYIPKDKEEDRFCMFLIHKYNEDIAADTLLYYEAGGAVRVYRYNY